VPLFTELPEIEVEALSSPASTGEDDETDLFEPSGADYDRLFLFSQSELNGLIGDLYLPKQSAEPWLQTARVKTAETWH